jgi:hypothetical protein
MAKRLKKNTTKRASTQAFAASAVTFPPIYEPTADDDTWQECLWSPSLNQYVCHDIPADQVPNHISSPRKLLAPQ